MAIGRRHVCIYPTGATTTPTTSTATQRDGGATYDAVYITMTAMEAAENGDYTTGGAKDVGSAGDGTILHVEIIDPDGDSDWSGAHDVGGFEFGGWKTAKAGDGSCVEIKTFGTARSSNGLYDTDAYVIDHGSDSECVDIDNDFDVGTSYIDIEFDGVQFRHHTTAHRVVYIHSSQSAKQISFLNCYMLNETAGTNFNSELEDVTNFVLRVKNCIIQGGTDCMEVAPLNVAHIYNCTIFGGSDNGIQTTNVGVQPVNCAVFNNVGDDWKYGFDDPYPNFCASDDYTDEGTNGVDISPGATEADEWDKAFTNYSATPPDVTIKDASSVLHHDINTYQSQTNDSEVPSTDIIGTARPDGSEDCGAFQFVGAPTGWSAGDVTGVAATDISKIMGVAIADIAKVGGV